ncbi:unnamed protein product [Lampetra fluviatilis]
MRMFWVTALLHGAQRGREVGEVRRFTLPFPTGHREMGEVRRLTLPFPTGHREMGEPTAKATELVVHGDDGDDHLHYLVVTPSPPTPPPHRVPWLSSRLRTTQRRQQRGITRKLEGSGRSRVRRARAEQADATTLDPTCDPTIAARSLSVACSASAHCR